MDTIDIELCGALPHKVLILGGTGFIGAEVARQLVNEGVLVRVAARHLPSTNTASYLRNVEIVTGEVEDSVFLKSAMTGVDHVVYAVGCPFPEESNSIPIESLFRTLPGLMNTLEQLRSFPGVGLTFLSSGGTIYGNPSGVPITEDASCNPITAYGVMKLTAEKFIGMHSTLYGIPTRILRVANAYGARQSSSTGQGVIAAFINAALNATPIHIFGDGSVVRDYVHVSDVAKATTELLKGPSVKDVFNVGSGNGYTIAEVLTLVERVTGRELAVERRDARDFDVAKVILDIGQLKSRIAWRPMTLEEGIAHTWRNVKELGSTLSLAEQPI